MPPTPTLDHLLKPFKEHKQATAIWGILGFFILLRLFAFFFLPEPPPPPVNPTPTPTATPSPTPNDREKYIRSLWGSLYGRTPPKEHIRGLKSRDIELLERYIEAKEQQEKSSTVAPLVPTVAPPQKAITPVQPLGSGTGVE